MNKDPFRDQADKLKQKIERVQEETKPKKREPLPPRSELHREKKKKNKVKLKYPLISLLLLFFILMPLTVFSIYSYFDSRNEPLVVLSEENNEVEEVQYERTDEEEDSGVVSEENPEAELHDEDETVPEKSQESVNDAERNKDEKKLPAAKAAEVKEPEREEPAPEESDSVPPQETNPQIIYHTVQPQETIFRIAMKYYHSQDGIEKIKQANNLPSNEIQSGQVLKILISE